LEQTNRADLLDNFEVNTLGSFLVAKEAGLLMAGQSSGGSIVHIGDWAVQRPYSGFSAYFISKGSIQTMTRLLAVELASRNPRVRVNAVLPGPVMLAAEIDANREKQIADDCLLRRSGTAQDVAQAVYFLATSPFITGVCLPVDGGRWVHAQSALDGIAHPSVGTVS
jgi:pteridine reductase